ncbi:MAG: histone acetyltransferase 1 [Thelocarpon superellum]|nr:MAG: histone acetyltransferase 1 [Thelocarpon superellum]
MADSAECKYVRAESQDDSSSGKGSSDANKATTISLVRPGPKPAETVAKFHPQFTYPIFGEAQTIFGYSNLRINLHFATHDLRPNLTVTWDKQYPAVQDTVATDVKGTLEEWLPPTSFEPLPKWYDEIQTDKSAKDFHPPGKLLSSYKINNKTYEIWHGQLADSAIRRILTHMQIFIPFFVEGGTYIHLEDPDWSLHRWSIFLLYEKLEEVSDPTKAPYSFIGYCTAYRYFFLATSPETALKPSSSEPTFPFPQTDHTELPSRQRISQFLILPPYHRQGHGSHFYTALTTAFMADPSIHEITVEDPNESFDDLRDFCDLARLRQIPEFTSLSINTTVQIPSKGRLPTDELLSPAILNALRAKTKIAPRQFQRLVEMQLLSRIPAPYRRSSHAGPNAPTLSTANATDPEWEQQYRRWCLLTKQRLYKFNRDSLAQLDRPERLDKLEEVLDSVEAGYVDFLERAHAVSDVDVAGKRKAGLSGESSEETLKNGGGLDDANGDEGPATKKVKI